MSDRGHIGLQAGRHSLLGITVHALDREELLQEVSSGIVSGCVNRIYGNHNLHSLHLYRKVSELREFCDKCYLAHIDGMSLALLGRMIGLPFRREHRLTYLDWIEPFLALAESRRWKIYVLGGSKDHAVKLPAVLAEKYPKLDLRAHHGFVGPSDDAEVCAEIAEFQPEILMVGMGMPAQEKWILRALPRLRVNAIFNCGAAFEYLAGNKYRPPRWAGRVGLEWLFRMASEPGRLASRYLVEPVFLFPLIAAAFWNDGILGLARRVDSTSSARPMR